MGETLRWQHSTAQRTQGAPQGKCMLRPCFVCRRHRSKGAPELSSPSQYLFQPSGCARHTRDVAALSVLAARAGRLPAQTVSQERRRLLAAPLLRAQGRAKLRRHLRAGASGTPPTGPSLHPVSCPSTGRISLLFQRAHRSAACQEAARCGPFGERQDRDRTAARGSGFASP